MLFGHIQFWFEDDSNHYAKSTVMPKYIFQYSQSHIFFIFNKTMLQLKLLQVSYLFSFFYTLSPLWSQYLIIWTNWQIIFSFSNKRGELTVCGKIQCNNIPIGEYLLPLLTIGKTICYFCTYNMEQIQYSFAGNRPMAYTYCRTHSL